MLTDSTIEAAARLAETEKYAHMYGLAWYRMTDPLRTYALKILGDLTPRQTLLDVGCGRGELLNAALALGYLDAKGTEVVPYLIDGKRVCCAYAHELPHASASVDTVTCLDVLEHLLPGDEVRAMSELKRVATHHVLLSVANWSALHDGIQLHVNRRPYEEWDRLIRAAFIGWQVRWLDAPTPSNWWLATSQ